MTLYLPDSTSLVLLGRRNRAVAFALRRLLAERHRLILCPITLAEYYSGRVPGRDPEIDIFLAGLPYEGITRSDAVRAGLYRRSFRAVGIQLQMTDTLIAAIAARLGAVILTENRKDFPMDDVTVQSLLA